MKNPEFKTCLTIEFPSLSLFDESAIATSLDNLLRKKAWGYYLGSKRVPIEGAKSNFGPVEFFLHIHTQHYQMGRPFIEKQLQENVPIAGSRIKTGLNWLIRKDDNLEVFSRIRQLVFVDSSEQGVSITHPERIAYAISSTPNARFIIKRNEDEGRIQPLSSTYFVLCV